jgi:hypothetical protein
MSEIEKRLVQLRHADDVYAITKRAYATTADPSMRERYLYYLYCMHRQLEERARSDIGLEEHRSSHLQPHFKTMLGVSSLLSALAAIATSKLVHVPAKAVAGSVGILGGAGGAVVGWIYSIFGTFSPTAANAAAATSAASWRNSVEQTTLDIVGRIGITDTAIAAGLIVFVALMTVFLFVIAGCGTLHAALEKGIRIEMFGIWKLHTNTQAIHRIPTTTQLTFPALSQSLHASEQPITNTISKESDTQSM